MSNVKRSPKTISFTHVHGSRHLLHACPWLPPQVAPDFCYPEPSCLCTEILFLFGVKMWAPSSTPSNHPAATAWVRHLDRADIETAAVPVPNTLHPRSLEQSSALGQGCKGSMKRNLSRNQAKSQSSKDSMCHCCCPQGAVPLRPWKLSHSTRRQGKNLASAKGAGKHSPCLSRGCSVG